MTLNRMLTTVALGAAISGGALLAQDDARIYQTTFCVKATGSTTALDKFLQETSKPVAQVRLDGGRIAGWGYHRVAGSMGQDTKCDFLITTRYENTFPEPGESTLAKDLEKAGVSMSVEQYVEKRNSLSKLVSADRVVRLAGFGDLKKGDYFQTNMMKMNQGAKTSEFLKFEREGWMPLAKAAAETDHPRKGWSLWRRIYPSGTSESFDYVTVDMFRNWQGVWQPQGFPDSLVKKVHPSKTMTELFAPMAGVYNIVHRDLYEVRENLRPTGSASREAKR